MTDNLFSNFLVAHAFLTSNSESIVSSNISKELLLTGFGLSTGDFLLAQVLTTSESRFLPSFLFADSLSSFQVFFGQQAIQNTSQVIIDKSELPGLTLSRENTAESLFVGLLNRLLIHATPDITTQIEASLWEIQKKTFRNDTMIIKVYNLLKTVDKYEIETEQPSDVVNPNSY